MTTALRPGKEIAESIRQHVRQHEHHFHGGNRCTIVRQQWAAWLLLLLGLHLDEAREVIDRLILFAEHPNEGGPDNWYGPLRG